jgi:hypothetical protein
MTVLGSASERSVTETSERKNSHLRQCPVSYSNYPRLFFYLSDHRNQPETAFLCYQDLELCAFSSSPTLMTNSRLRRPGGKGRRETEQLGMDDDFFYLRRT